MLSATTLELASMNASALPQSLHDWKCTGNADIPWDEQIVGCSNAIKSGRYTGKDLAAAFNDRGRLLLSRHCKWHAGLVGPRHPRLRRGNQTQSELVRAISNRGNAYLAKRQYDRAIQDYDQAIKLDLNEAIPLNNRGNAYYKIGQVDCAIQDFDLAITLNPIFSEALNNRGLAYISKGQYDRAIQDFDQVLKLDPKDADAIRNRAMAIARKNN